MKSTPLSRSRLPQLDGGLFLVDGGIETFLIYHEGLDVPHFAARLPSSPTGTFRTDNRYRPRFRLSMRPPKGL